MTEPVTAITDWILGAFTLALAWRLRRFWRLAFIAAGVASLAGGVYHAFVLRLPYWLGESLWKVTVWSIGTAALYLVIAASTVCLSPRAARTMSTIALVQWITYFLWMFSHDEFVWVIADYAPSMICVVVIYAIGYRRQREAAPFVFAGIGVAIVAAGVQASSLQVGAFNHNDIYHLIQMGSMWLLYKGGAAEIGRPEMVS